MRPDPSTIADVWDDPARKWPSIVYVETTNYCNANCTACLNDRVQRPRSVMSLDTFRRVADKVKARGLRIGAMFCYGEPTLDRGLEDKFAYAKSIDVLTSHVGLNTNVSMLTEDRFDAILAHVPNIILSFFNVGSEFERLTGGLKWERCYTNACRFIEYRDKVAPGYPIFISVNKVKGHDLDAVKQAFSKYKVEYVQDAELRYDGGRCVEGVIDRMIMFNNWRCDGFRGALQIKPDLGCEYCAYDIIGTPAGGETRFSSNFLNDSWEDLERKFRARWRECSTLCARCDYWKLCKRVIANGFKPIAQ